MYSIQFCKYNNRIVHVMCMYPLCILLHAMLKRNWVCNKRDIVTCAHLRAMRWTGKKLLEQYSEASLHTVAAAPNQLNFLCR